jgi:hypothetical protein
METKRTFVNTKVKNVMLLKWIPIAEDRTPLDIHMGYQDPDKLVKEYCDAIWEVSRHTYKYEIVKEETISYVTNLAGDFEYPLPHLYEVLEGKREPRSPIHIDYSALMREYEIPLLISGREIDEVWLMGYPYAGFHEAVMGGPRPIWLTGPSIPDTENSLRRFVVMGFDYSQDLGGMLEAFIHRAEATMHTVYEMHPPKLNAWKKFTMIDKLSPQNAGVGTAHFAPNSLSDYDWKNPRYVLSNCNDWENYPHLTGKVTTVNCTEWGHGSRIEHHKWWLNHLPHGVDKTDGVYNNWWHYIMSPDWVNG